GYRHTQMVDVAEALGVAKGTVYGYVESKGALLDAAVRYADGHLPVPPLTAFPLPTPPPGSTARHVRERLEEEVRTLELGAALARSAPEPAEFERVVRDLFRRMSRNRRALKLIDRCAVDHPELAAVWFEEGRWGQVALLSAYLERGIAGRHLRAVPSIPL